MLLLATLVLLAQAPAAAPPPTAVPPALTLRVAALDAAGVPAHVVDFCQEHLYAELQRQGFAVLRADAGAAQDAAAPVRAVVAGELVLFPSGFRLTVRALSAGADKVLGEHVSQAVPEQKLLDQLTEAVAALTPLLRTQLAPTPLPAAAPAHRDAAALRRWAWAPTAGGALFLGAGTAFLLRARAHDRELKAPGPGDPALDGEAVARAGRRAQTLSRVSYVLGGVGVLTGAAFYYLPVQRLWGGEGKSQLQLQLTPGGVGVSGVLP